MQIEVRDGDIETALKIFKRGVEKDGIHQEIKRRLAFAKPSDRRKAKEIVAARRRREREQRRVKVFKNRRVYDPDIQIRRFNESHRIG
jgi:small subunit ribosomal protein S21